MADPKPAPRIVIDARMVSPVPHGISRYVKLLASGLEKLGALAYDPVFLVSADGGAELPARFERVRVSAPFLNARELVEIPWMLKKLRPSFYHSPSFSSLIRCPCPWIVTLHDLNHLHFGGLREKIYYRTILRSFALGAQRILTVSEFSQREIARWLELPPARIEIVYNALTPVLRSPNPAGVSESTPNTLQAGQYFIAASNYDKPHKNGEMLLAAYCEALRREPGLPSLVVNAGREALPAFARDQPGIVPVGKIPDADLQYLLSHARAALFPSLYEGFGLLPLESAMLGARLIVSDIPAHREGLVDFSPPQLTWLDPTEQESWVQAFVGTKGRTAVSEKHAPDPAQPEKAAARFSERALAEHMDRIYRSVLLDLNP